MPVIVENRPGRRQHASAPAAVAKAAPDGHTLLFANTSVSVNPSLFKTLPYDTLRDLAPVVYLSPSPNVLLAQKSLGVNTLKELLALAKSRAANPLSYASVGKGSAHHFCMELLQERGRRGAAARALSRASRRRCWRSTAARSISIAATSRARSRCCRATR